MSIVFNTVKYLLDEATAKKITIYSSNTCKELQDLVAPEQLEERFGGKAPNREPGNYWPPTLNNTNYGAGQFSGYGEEATECEKFDLGEIDDHEFDKVSLIGSIKQAEA
mmetsp:Transcript_3953/g.5960  ORF Transcript_3953/g.5960 Transcript_3953/m.5960 type:complete len:109 (-) Transcript_3953:26-352(-)